MLPRRLFRFVDHARPGGDRLKFLWGQRGFGGQIEIAKTAGGDHDAGIHGAERGVESVHRFVEGCPDAVVVLRHFAQSRVQLSAEALDFDRFI